MSTRMNRLALCVIIVASARASVAQSTRRVAATTQPVRETVADAEAEGAVYPHGPRREHGPTQFAGRGPAERTCTNGPTTVSIAVPWVISSGDFVIGGQLGGYSPPNVGRQSKIWWVPYHNPEEYGTTLLVRGAHLGVRGDTTRYEQPDDAWPSAGFGPGRALKSDAFFPSGVTLPHAGRWLLIATAGDDWGCFILSTGA